ncbi:hypothetical protein [Actinomadura alba]|uniref:AMP-binding enzyme C-terminal domain-containing protein n=1 Tax=Actinomadura alba TaxID=406431 RepID=A0ABR7LUS5_9ACTN|nr:hypothetical protein [Actinomadura alba]MBC6468546.1 hypothetical protein [Actinomadura alba]
MGSGAAQPFPGVTSKWAAEAASDEVAHARPQPVDNMFSPEIDDLGGLVEAIPKSAVGKILRRALRDPLWAGVDRGR